MMARKLNAPILVPLGVVSLAAAALLAVAVRHGLGIIGDSVVLYFGPAQALADGLGFVTPITGPTTASAYGPMLSNMPGYPVVLAVLLRLGIGLDNGARLLALVLFPATLFLAGLSIWRITRSEWLAAGGSAALALCWGVIPVVYAFAMTEPLFLFLVAGAVYGLVRYFERPSIGWVLAVAAMLSLAMLTRYAAAPLIGVAAVSPFTTQLPVRRKIEHGLMFLGLTSTIVVPWFNHNLLAAGTATGREPHLYMSRIGEFLVGADPLFAASAWFVIFSVAVLLAGRQLVQSGPLTILSVMVIAYLVFLSFVKVFIDPVISFDPRLLSPVQMLGTIVLASSFPQWWSKLTRVGKGQLLTRPLVVTGAVAAGASAIWVSLFYSAGPDASFGHARLLVLVAGSGLMAAAVLLATLRLLHREVRMNAGLLLSLVVTGAMLYSSKTVYEVLERRDCPQYCSREWQGSEVLQWAKELPGPLWTNDPFALYYHSGKPAKQLPGLEGGGQGSEGTELSHTGKAIARQQGFVVYIKGPQGKVQGLYDSPEDIWSALRVQPLLRANDGVILGPCDPCSP